MERTPKTSHTLPTNREGLIAFAEQLASMAKVLGRTELEHPSSETFAALAQGAIAQAAADVARAAMVLESVFGRPGTARE